eukprot:SM000236S08020  [mRNA]  locus=s236:23334:23628:- [translate_table: standard]
MDIYGGYGVKWSSLIQHLARLVDARRRSRGGSLGHSSIPQALRSQALALHQRAGRALSQASGFRGGAPAPQVSLSDLFVLTRGY